MAKKKGTVTKIVESLESMIGMGPAKTTKKAKKKPAPAAKKKTAAKQPAAKKKAAGRKK